MLSAQTVGAPKRIQTDLLPVLAYTTNVYEEVEPSLFS